MRAPARPTTTLLATAALVIGGLAVTAPPAGASHDVTPARVAGETRAATAANVAALAYPDGTDVAFVARDDAFADALAAAALAGFEDAPILLTRSDELTDVTDRALDDLGVRNVTILGGPAAVSEDVEAQLEEDHAVARIAGADRIETANELARAVQRNNDGRANFPGGQRAVFVANGERFPDALAAAAPAAARQIPTVLVHAGDVPDATAETLQELQIELAIIVGGSAVVSEDVRAELEGMGITVDRVAGPTRTATATAVAEFARAYLDFDATRPLLARGDAFPDALAAGPLGGVQRAPILLTAAPDDLGAPTTDWLATRCGDVAVVRAVGGEAAVTPATLARAEEVAEDCHAGEGESAQTYGVAPQEAIVAEPGHEQEFSVFARRDDQELTGPVDIVLFPCEQVDAVTGSGDPRFHDADGDGHADGIESTDTGAAILTYATGTDDPGEKGKRDAMPNEDGIIEFGVRSDAADCTVPTVFADQNDNSALDLDADGDPVEPYGVGQIRWQ